MMIMRMIRIVINIRPISDSQLKHKFSQVNNSLANCKLILMMMTVVLEILTMVNMAMDDDNSNSPSHMTIAVEWVGYEVE